jgi:hypothetical protein
MTTRSFRLIDEVAALIDRLDVGPLEIARLREKAGRLEAECGCTSSGIFFLVAAATAVLYALPTGHTDLVSIGALTAGTFVAGMVGKAFGIGVARTRLRFLKRSLQRQLADSRAD